MRFFTIALFAVSAMAQQPYEGNSHIPNSHDVYEAAPRPRHAVHVRWSYNDGSPVKRFDVIRTTYPDGPSVYIGSIEVQPRTPKDCDSAVYGCFVDVEYVLADTRPLVEDAVYRYSVVAIKPDGRGRVRAADLVTIPVTDRTGEFDLPEKDAPRGVSARVVR